MPDLTGRVSVKWDRLPGPPVTVVVSRISIKDERLLGGEIVLQPPHEEWLAVLVALVDKVVKVNYTLTPTEPPVLTINSVENVR